MKPRAELHQSAPILHISFSVDPPGAYVQKIVAWLRVNIHKYALITVGLQPNIGAGCIVRTTNKLFDFSLREFFAEKRGFFIEKLHAAVADPGENQSLPQAVTSEEAPDVAPQVAPLSSAPSTQPAPPSQSGDKS